MLHHNLLNVTTIVVFSQLNWICITWTTRMYHQFYWLNILLHLFNSLFSRTTWVSRHQKGKPFWILMKQEMTGWQSHQLDHMHIICNSLQTDNHASTSPLSFHRPDALPATQPTASKHWRQWLNILYNHFNMNQIPARWSSIKLYVAHLASPWRLCITLRLPPRSLSFFLSLLSLQSLGLPLLHLLLMVLFPQRRRRHFLSDLTRQHTRLVSFALIISLTTCTALPSQF